MKKFASRFLIFFSFQCALLPPPPNVRAQDLDNVTIGGRVADQNTAIGGRPQRDAPTSSQITTPPNQFGSCRK